MSCRVGCDEWSCGEASDIPEALFINVGKVKQDAQPVAGTNQIASRRSQTRSRVRRVREFEGDAMSKGVGATPDNAKRAQPCLVEHLESIEVWIDGLSPLEVKNDSQYALLEAVYEFANSTNNFDLPLRLGLKPEKTGDHRNSELLGVRRINSREGVNF